MLPPALLDRAYRDLLASFPLSPAHRQQLVRRGLDHAAITRAGYASLPVYGRLEVAQRLVSRYGPGIPGVYSRPNRTGSGWSLTTPPGILIPVRDPDGRIRALLVRLDRPQPSGKYRWFSSGGRPGGVSCGAPCHLARPITPDVSAGRLWITEGPLKADVVACLSRAPAIGLPGVSWRGALPLVTALAPAGIILAFDADKTLRPEVQQAETDLARCLLTWGYRVSIAAWALEKAKGIDDLLCRGQRPDRLALTDMRVPAPHLPPRVNPLASPGGMPRRREP